MTTSNSAKILDSSPGLKQASELLKNDKSTYSLAQCDATIWFVVGLTEYISLEKVGFLSLEFFTSQFRHVQILGSTTYPTQKWRLLDEVELSDSMRAPTNISPLSMGTCSAHEHKMCRVDA